MTVNQLLQDGRARLTKVSANEARIISSWCIERVLGLDRVESIVAAESEVSDEARVRFLELIDRCSKGEPVQYVCGFTEFYGCRLEVGPGVLIPRPETEQLVDLVVDHCSEIAEPNILDLGTGSGCIAVAVASTIPLAVVCAVDSSRGALSIAEKNTAGLQVRLVEADFTEAAAVGDLPGDLDVVVSNPPYVPQSEAEHLSRTVFDYEPHEALFAQPDLLSFYRSIADIASAKLKRGGLIAVEVHPDCADAIVDLIRSCGFEDVRILKDLAGNDRIVRGHRVNN